MRRATCAFLVPKAGSLSKRSCLGLQPRAVCRGWDVRAVPLQVAWGSVLSRRGFLEDGKMSCPHAFRGAGGGLA